MSHFLVKRATTAFEEALDHVFLDLASLRLRERLLTRVKRNERRGEAREVPHLSLNNIPVMDSGLGAVAGA